MNALLQTDEMFSIEPNKDIQYLQEFIIDSRIISEIYGLDNKEQEKITEIFRMRIPQYYLNLIEKPYDPIWLQAIPDIRELDDDGLQEDPFWEDNPRFSPVPNLTHRYPDRALFFVTDQCPLYCRFCMRKRKTQRGSKVNQETISQGIDYIKSTTKIREVILSGGDPFMLPKKTLFQILSDLHSLDHVEIIRIHTRMPCVMPQKVTEELSQMLSLFHPLFVVVHFNHPCEITKEASFALKLLSDAGIPLANQSVLLRGINDDTNIIKDLCLKLIKNRVRPYYLHQADPVHGTDHFRTRVEKGVEIIQQLNGRISGLAIPKFVVDGPGGGGKIPLQPNHDQHIFEDRVILKNCDGDTMIYPQVSLDS